MRKHKIGFRGSQGMVWRIQGRNRHCILYNDSKMPVRQVHLSGGVLEGDGFRFDGKWWMALE